MAITLNPLKSLTKKQREIFKDIVNGKHKTSTICSSRQFGKTFLIETLAIYLAWKDKNQEILFVAPSHGQAKKNFDSIKAKLNKDPAAAKFIIKKINSSSSDRFIELTNGSKIFFRSALKYDNFRGIHPDNIIIDEFAFIKEQAWLEAIKPTIAAKVHSKVIVASTPKGLGNLFHTWYMLGEDETRTRYKSYRGHWSDNPLYDHEEVADAKLTLPESIYLQEYEGQFIGANSTVFGDFSSNQTALSWDQYNNNDLEHFYGIDWSGNGDDSTVLTIMNEHGRIVLIK